MKIKKILKIFSIFSFPYFFCYFISYEFQGKIISLIDEIAGVSIFMVPVMLALSFGMFTYVDNMSKELTDLRNEVVREKYIGVQNKIADLKKEILLNAGLVIFLCVLERIIKSMMLYLPKIYHIFYSLNLELIFLSLRFSLFSVIIVSIIFQMAGFVIAVEYRTLIANNRK